MKPSYPRGLIPYLAGLLTALVSLLILYFVGLRGSQAPGMRWEVEAPIHWAARAKTAEPELPTDRRVDISGDVLNQLLALDAGIDNAEFPGGRRSPRWRKHDNPFVRPDRELGWALRPNARVAGFMLRTKDPFNFNPPIIYLDLEAKFSSVVREFLDRSTRLRFAHSVDPEGFRRTIPEVQSERKILMVGDSVTFGSAVNDEDTIASQLQRMIGASHKVVNAGVGGYSGLQAFQAARIQAGKGGWEALVYVASQNDFMERGGGISLEKARGILEKFATLKERFSGRIIFVLHMYMEYSLRDVLLDASGLSLEAHRSADAARRELPALAQRLGFAYVDWEREIVEPHLAQTGTIYSRFALYGDHAHPSPLGNRLLAERILVSLRARGSVSPKAG